MRLRDRVWEAVCAALDGSGRRSATGFTNINCPMCVRRGETADRRRRCGIKYGDSGIRIACFNCQFRTGFTVGEYLSRSMQDFLREIGVSSIEVMRLAHYASSLRRVVQETPSLVVAPPVGERLLPTRSLPPGARSLAIWAAEECRDPHFLAVAAYLFSRGDVIAGALAYAWTPDPRYRDRLIVPCLDGGRVVGWIGRLAGPSPGPDIPKYYNDTPRDLLFNAGVLARPDRRYALLVEGVLDAVAIDGISPLGAKLSPAQIAWIRSSGKQIIVVADRDKAGDRLIDIALEQDWTVAFPRGGVGQMKWEATVKDAADAVARYGRLYTLRSIFAGCAHSRVEVNVRRQLTLSAGHCGR